MGFNYQRCMYSSINLLNEASENYKWMIQMLFPMLIDESINFLLLKEITSPGSIA